MSEQDPERLANGNDPLLKSLIEEGRKELASPAQLAAVAAKLGPILGGGGGPGGGGRGAARPGSAAAPNAAGMGLATKIGIAAVAVATAATVLRIVTIPQQAAAVPVASSEEAPLPVPSARDPAAEPEPDPLPAFSSMPVASATLPTATPRHVEAGVRPPIGKATPSTGVEMRLLTSAQDAINTDPAKALALCEDHARRFPTGLLVEEREALAIQALIALGRVDEAKKRADAFYVKFPDSPLTRRIHGLMP
jgi:hypothetical protein